MKRFRLSIWQIALAAFFAAIFFTIYSYSLRRDQRRERAVRTLLSLESGTTYVFFESGEHASEEAATGHHISHAMFHFLDEADLKEALSVLSRLDETESLDLHESELTAETFLGTGIFTRVKQLSVTGCQNLEADTTEAMTRAFPGIQTVSFADSDVEIESVQIAAAKWHLESIDLSGTPLAVSDVASALRSERSLTSVNVAELANREEILALAELDWLYAIDISFMDVTPRELATLISRTRWNEVVIYSAKLSDDDLSRIRENYPHVNILP